MVAVGQGHVKHLVLQVQDMDTKNHAHSTGTQAIVSFHVHEHGDSRNITKASNDIGMEGKKLPQEGIVCRHADCKLE